MVAPQIFLEEIRANGIDFFAGVPDSLMKSFLVLLEKEHSHHITANEGAALAMAAGYHLATGKTGLVYLQNSGLGNLINPLTSLADQEVYSIPMLLMTGWRGQPGKKDEPQHSKMGRITREMFDLLEVPYIILSQQSEWKQDLKKITGLAKELSKPVAILVEEGFFIVQAEENISVNTYNLSAEEVISNVYERLSENDIVVCTTGKAGRLFYKVNTERGNRLQRYFLNVGAMGHASSLATALSFYTDDHVVLFDGDGSLLMHMGALANSGLAPNKNFTYILLNNGSHQSVGGQPTAAFDMDIPAIAKACGFHDPLRIEDANELSAWLDTDWKKAKHFVEIRMNAITPSVLPRPSQSFKEAKDKLMEALFNKNV
jgi:phosphonopyruvate decarboxylase